MEAILGEHSIKLNLLQILQRCHHITLLIFKCHLFVDEHSVYLEYKHTDVFCPCLVSVTVPLQDARGRPLMKIWLRNCGKSAATCLASLGSKWVKQMCSIRVFFITALTDKEEIICPYFKTQSTLFSKP